MALEFEWDPRKAAANAVKHKVGFEEAATVFGDPLGCILADPRHSFEENRLVLLGTMKKAPKKHTAPDPDDILPEYDFSRAVRSPYASKDAMGSSVIVLEPDVAAAFPNARAANDALRALAGIIQKHTPNR